MLRRIEHVDLYRLAAACCSLAARKSVINLPAAWIFPNQTGTDCPAQPCARAIRREHSRQTPETLSHTNVRNRFAAPHQVWRSLLPASPTHDRLRGLHSRRSDDRARRSGAAVRNPPELLRPQSFIVIIAVSFTRDERKFMS
jgi:hypothetical protein